MVIQLAEPIWEGDCSVEECKLGRIAGYVLHRSDGTPDVLVITNTSKPPDDCTTALRMPGFSLPENRLASLDLSQGQWIKHPAQPAASSTLAEFEKRNEQVRHSWSDKFSYRLENATDGTPGLRPPQIGAIHAAQSHFSVHRNPATIVMPTGTGKTETMLSILVAEQCTRLLVVVPTDALRIQLSDKFIGWGVLKLAGVIAADTQYPVVGILRQRPRTPKDIEAFVRKCNVVVTTMAAIGNCAVPIQEKLASLCTHLFIDEAHHVGAPTWNRFKSMFRNSRILQFTATPYRMDEKPVGEQLIFAYSLRQAQDDGYFQKISFKPVTEFDPRKRDQAIAAAAVEQLRADLSKGHIVMARVGSIARANQVFKIYEPFKEFNPVQIHTGITSGIEREKIRKQIPSGESRIVVCVDMLGEGFDLPELKIAAFHDIRRSLPVTLQLAGRFTRAKPGLGNATFIANIADVDVTDELRKLYQRDVDWNHLLPALSENAIKEEFDLWEFLAGFKRFPEEISLQNVRPAMSAVAYRTSCKDWTPENFAKGIAGHASLDRCYHDINPNQNTLVILTTRRISLDWARIDDIYSWDWQLYILHWDKAQKLLFIHNSSNSGFFKELAKSVAGDDVVPVRGPEIFRCLASVNRLRLQNVGLLEQLGRLIRFTMRAGSDVEHGMSEAQKQKAIKSNLFGAGFENGHRTTIGCSYKGRIWSMKVTNLFEFRNWCQSVGSRLVDESLDPEEVLRGTLVPRLVDKRPDVTPIAVEWPECVYHESETTFALEFGGEQAYLCEADIALNKPGTSGPLRLDVFTDSQRSTVNLEIFKTGEVIDYRFVQTSGPATVMRRGGTAVSLAEFFTEHPPMIWFANGASLRGHELVELKKQPEPFPKGRIETWAWKGVDIREESQGANRSKSSIQYRVIKELKKRSFSVVFDDDSSGEAADVVAIHEAKQGLEIEFWHCKYSSESQPGARIADMYEVCGQAQKCIRWIERPIELLNHLLRREDLRQTTRFDVGTKDDVWRILEKSRRSRISLQVCVVQPGLSKAKASREQLELLAVTEHYLMDTFKVAMRVIASD